MDIYTAWISGTVTELVVRRNLTVLKTLLMFTEPLSYTAGNIPAGYTQQTFYVYAVTALHNRLLADGVRHLVSLLGPNDGGLSSSTDQAALNFTVAQLGGVLDIWSSHDYDLQGYAAWHAMYAGATAVTGPTGKPFWVDEGGAGPEGVRNSSAYGTYVGAWQAALTNAGCSNSFLWLLQDQQYVWPLENVTNGDSFVNGLHRWGLQFWMPLSTAVRPAFYAHSVMSAFLRAPQGAPYATSCSVEGVTPGAVVAAAIAGGSPSGGRPDYRALLLVNEGATPVSVTVAATGPAPGGTTAYSRFLYDPAAVPTDGQPLPPSGSHPADGSPIADTLPPGAVVVWATPWEAPA